MLILAHIKARSPSTSSSSTQSPDVIAYLPVDYTISRISLSKEKKTNFMAPFYGWGSTASRLEPLRGGSLLITTKFPEIPGTHFIDLGRMKG